ncbi:MAG: transketolase family protein [Thermoplasmata archaeon]|nr:transketolase family protein [Thermoplasmata archaeon]
MKVMENPRTAFGETLVELGRKDPDIVSLGADLSSSTKTSMFNDAFPDRFFNCGIAEANMMGVAAGLAIAGKKPFPSTFAVFATGRVYDQIRQSIAYPNLDVKIVATHAGITVGGDGASHQINEDIALMSVLPNMRVIVPADALETRKVVRAAVESPGPMYIRLCRTDMPRVTDGDTPFKIGKWNVLRDGDDISLMGTGLMVERCLDAAAMLRDRGVDAAVINVSTVKPIDRETLFRYARKTGAVVTAEEHSVLLGIGSIIATALVESYPVPLHRIGIPDIFSRSGESEELMGMFGLTAENVVKTALGVLELK